MEFYVHLGALAQPLKRFNSQRDGILLQDIWLISQDLSRFNSQRDGILRKELVPIWRGFLKFQFPTGWNSTKWSSAGFCNVSKSFNSQRDRILPKWHFDAKQLRVVSIPNGMEFYIEKIKAETEIASFNSQRDGILPVNLAVCYLSRSVSIPNGMEFYLISSLLGVISSRFQFPTGWNSTLCDFGAFVLCDVSIPNGMEFYQRCEYIEILHL